jgi:hypothetical protein
MSKMNYNRPQKVAPPFYPDAAKLRGCPHVWLKKSDKWDQCTICQKFKIRENFLLAHPEFRRPTRTGSTAMERRAASTVSESRKDLV